MLSRGDGVTWAREGSRRTIWIPAQARSGSTLLMDMLSVPVTFGHSSRPDSMDGKFVLFEPCHPGDYANNADWETSANLTNACGQIIESIATCNFSHIAHLAGWDRIQSQGLPQPYSKEVSRNACKRAHLVVFKSVFKPPEAWNFVQPRLQHIPSLLAVVNVRDPRGVIASQIRLWGRHTSNQWGNTLEGICQYYSSLHGVSHPRLMVVKFEDMISTPWSTMQRMYRFLGLEFGDRQEAWIWNRFGGGESTANCTRDGKLKGANYSTCQRDVGSVINKWRNELTPQDLHGWWGEACRTVARDFGYN